MQNAQPSLFARDDTFFGVCEAIGEDIGISPILLRLAFTGLLFFNPVAALGGYAVAGAIVLLSRLLFPNPRLPAQAGPAVEEAPLKADNETEQYPLPLAA